MLDIKETIQNDIKYIFSQLEELRTNYPWSYITSQTYQEPDFRPYRSMVFCLVDTFHNYKYLYYNYNNEYVDKFVRGFFIDKLTYEIKKLHETIESIDKSKEEYQHFNNGYKQYKCLSDAYIKLTRLYVEIERL